MVSRQDLDIFPPNCGGTRPSHRRLVLRPGDLIKYLYDEFIDYSSRPKFGRLGGEMGDNVLVEDKVLFLASLAMAAQHLYWSAIHR